MPLVRPSAPFGGETQAGFLGVNLRTDRLNMQDGDVVRAINADFHTMPGSILRRKGFTRIFGFPTGVRISQLWKISGALYASQGDTLYRDSTALVSSGMAGHTSLVPYQPLNDPGTWVFVANAGVGGTVKADLASSTVRNWGISPPTAAPTIAAGAAGSISGAYRAVYTYARVVGSAIAHESDPSPVPSAAISLLSQQLNVAVVASSDPQVTHIRIYRTAASGTSYFFDQQVANASATIASTQADTALGTEVESDNEVPPDASWAGLFQDHVFLCGVADTPNGLFYSKRFRPESFPTDQYLLIGPPTDPLLAGVPSAAFLGVFTRTTKYRVFGNDVSGFNYLEAMSTRGTLAAHTITPVSQGALFIARDGIFATSFVAADTELSQAIQSLFFGETRNGYAPIDFNELGVMALAEYKRRWYFSYQDTAGARMLAVYSQDTGKWYFYQLPVRALFDDEATDQLLMGADSGDVYTLETGTSDNGTAIALTVELPLRTGGERFRQKRFAWVRTDIDTAGDTVHVDIYVDERLVQTLTITGARQRRLHRLPNALGYTYHCVVRATGDCTIHAIQVLGQPWEAV